MTMKMVKQNSFRVFAGLSLLALAACSSAPARVADAYYDLRPEIAPMNFGSDKVLEIQSVSVKGLQSARPLVFQASSSPVQYQEVRGHLWHVSPSSLWERAVATTLAAASEDLVIGTSDTVDEEDFRLKLTVSQFHFIPDHLARIDFDAVLKDSRGKIVSVHRYEAEEPLDGSGYANAVLGLEKALSAALQLMANDIQIALMKQES